MEGQHLHQRLCSFNSTMVQVKVIVEPIHAELINAKSIGRKLSKLDGILVAPGFGERGVEGKLAAVRYARTHSLPFLGICLGMQIAVIEFARDVLKLEDANSTEMDPNTPHPVISMMEDQKNITEMGGTMRLGSWKCDLKKDSLASKIYKSKVIEERHRHRFEFNSIYREQFEAAGMVATGINPDTGLVEIIEIPSHPWFMGVQYHPEYKSTVANPHPLFVAFVKAVHDHAAKNK